MQPTSLTPLLTTDRLDDVRGFYVDLLGFTITFDGHGYLGLRAPGDAGIELGFMRPDDDTQARFGGAGLTLCLQVEDVDAAHADWCERGVTFVQPPRDNPWGDRSAVALDPLGIALYVMQPIELAPEFAADVRA